MGNINTAYENIDNKPMEIQLSYSAEYGDIDRLSYLLKSFCCDGKLDIDAAKCSLWTPLFMAAKQGHTECVKMLLDAGAVDGINEENAGWTPLWVATYAGHGDCVQLLVEAGAHLEAKDPETPVFIAAREDRRGCLKVLLDAGGSVDVNDRQQQTPLHVACQEGNSECVQMLVAAGADLERRDVYGKTPLLCACEGGDEKCLEILLVSGADPNVVATSGNMPGYFPMHICASKTKLASLKVLWKYGANLHFVKNVRPSDLAVSKPVINYLESLEGTVRTLKEIARIAIRRLVKNSQMRELANEYDLPESLLKYLVFER